MGIVDVFVFKMVDSNDVIDEFLEDMGNLTDNLDDSSIDSDNLERASIHYLAVQVFSL